jgi:hypothetical protein
MRVAVGHSACGSLQYPGAHMNVCCPRCNTRFNVPDHAAGMAATCANQQCRARFVIPEAASQVPLDAPRGGMVPTGLPPGRSASGPAEIAIQLDTRPKRTSSVIVRPATPSNSMGIVSLVVGILALLLCWLPMMNRLGYVVGGLGVVLGLLGFVVASQHRGASMGFPIGGLVLSIVGLVLAFQMDQGVQRIKTAVKDAFAEDKTSRSRQPSRNAATRDTKSGATGKTKPEEPKRWSDATKAIVTREEVAVSIASARIDRVIKTGIAGRQQVGPFLTIAVQVTNRSGTRKVDFRGWNNDLDLLGPRCTLVDEHGNEYAQKRTGVDGKYEGQVLTETIAPRGSMNDVLIFEPPVDAAQELRLEIPGGPLGREGTYRFMIPRRMFMPEQGAAGKATVDVK